jgi:adenosylhomocysteinase
MNQTRRRSLSLRTLTYRGAHRAGAVTPLLARDRQRSRTNRSGFGSSVGGHAPLARSTFFLDALAQVADIACVLPKPKPIDRTVLLRIRDRYDIDVLDRNTLTHGQQLSALISRHSIGQRSLVAIDIGGYFASAVEHLAANAPLAGVVEDTENGHQRYERRLPTPFPCPVFSVARSPLKNAEDYLIGHSVVFSTEGLMRSRGDVLQGSFGLRDRLRQNWT